MEFKKAHIEEEWMDLVNEFPEFILELSPYVETWYESMIKHCEKFNLTPITKEDLTNLRYGFECSIGWKELIREYFTEVRKLMQKVELNGHDVHYKTCIFKEKFGELVDQGDFYGDDRNLYIKEFNEIGKILYRSNKICEVCGKEATMNRNGFWMKTLCDVHARERSYTVVG